MIYSFKKKIWGHYLHYYFLSSCSIARQIQKYVALLCELEALSKCVQVGNAQEIDVPALVRIFYHYAGWAQLLETEMPDWKYHGVGMFPLSNLLFEMFPLVLVILDLALLFLRSNDWC